MNYALKSVKVSGFVQKHRAAKLLPWTAGVCSAKAEAFECLNATHNTLLLLSLVMLFSDKGVFPNQACSGFELNRRSVSGLNTKGR
jgi:hypothetical protein